MAAPQYATLTQLRDQIDERLLKQLTSDDQTDGVLDLTTNTKLKTALEVASSDIESHTLRGQRYTTADLVALQAAGDMTLVGLAGKLTVWNLVARRGGDVPESIESQHREAMRILKALADGELIFGKSTSAAAAGVIEARVVTPNQRTEFGLASDSAFFPPAQDRIV